MSGVHECIFSYRTVWFLLLKYARAEFRDGGVAVGPAVRNWALLKKCRAGWDRVRRAHDWQTHGLSRVDLVIEFVDIVAVVLNHGD